MQVDHSTRIIDHDRIKLLVPHHISIEFMPAHYQWFRVPESPETTSYN
jgi:hypothetical protein